MILPLFSQINPNIFQLIYHISSLYLVYIPLTIGFTSVYHIILIWIHLKQWLQSFFSASSGEVGLGERELRPLSCGNGSRHGMPIFLHNIINIINICQMFIDVYWCLLMFIVVYDCICCINIRSSISSSHLNSPSRYFLAKDIGKAQQPPVGWRFPWQPAQPFVPPSACAGRDGLPWHFGWVFTSYNSHLTSFNNLTSKKWWN